MNNKDTYRGLAELASAALGPILGHDNAVAVLQALLTGNRVELNGVTYLYNEEAGLQYAGERIVHGANGQPLSGEEVLIHMPISLVEFVRLARSASKGEIVRATAASAVKRMARR